MLLETLSNISKKEAKERALDVEEAAEKGSSVQNGLSTVAIYLLVDDLCSLLSYQVDFECP